MKISYYSYRVKQSLPVTYFEIINVHISMKKKIILQFKGCSTRYGKTNCYDFRQKWSYAIPLEIIYMTPLLSWNPYKFDFHEWKNERNVTAGGRNGGLTEDKAYNGNHKRLFFRTPAEFFGK